mmetsp:Transcript_12081/g.35605  ORF Transcript_12081/g.35605 Transcript_12081/m.35605 type:complete len:225 (-) Transcript_12081:1079-1753(-)
MCSAVGRASGAPSAGPTPARWAGSRTPPNPAPPNPAPPSPPPRSPGSQTKWRDARSTGRGGRAHPSISGLASRQHLGCISAASLLRRSITCSMVHGGKRTSFSPANCERSEMSAPWWKPVSVSREGRRLHSTLGPASLMYCDVMLRLREVVMNAGSVAQMRPSSARTQNESGSSPRTKRYRGSSASSGSVMAESLRIARQRCDTVAVYVTSGCAASMRRNPPIV